MTKSPHARRRISHLALSSLDLLIHLLDLSSLMRQFEEQGLLVLDQHSRSVEFLNLSFFQHQNLVRIHDGFYAMGNRENGAVLELLTNGLLDQLVRLDINSGCSFVQDNNLGLA